MTASGYLALLIGVLVLGSAAGYAAAGMRQRSRRNRTPGPTVAELLRRLVHTSVTGVAVFNKFGDVVLHNARAVEFGLVRDNRPDPRARTAADEALRSDGAVAVDLSPEEPADYGRAPSAVLGWARPLGDGFTVVDVADESEAVRLEATRRDFVANISHELKTPVGGLALLAEAVLDAADRPDEVRHFAGKLRHESNRLGALVSELIALSRLQGAQKLPEPTTVEVDDVIAEALDRSQVAAESAGIAVTADEPAGLLVDGDRTLLVTALSNLIDNAISYSPHGTPVSVSRRRNGHGVEIAVTDRGVGIDPEHQQRVFERFYRADPARSRSTGGTGLGLAIVKHIAANHGGEVTLWSRPGTGSTFTLRLPPARSDERAEASEQRLLEAAGPGVAPADTGGVAR